MELILTFLDGAVTGEGRDWVGDFRIKGRYQVEDGKCWWTKAYVKKHAIAYQGYNEGKGIWGTWEYQSNWKGGFYIWPVAMDDPTQAKLTEAIEEPASVPAFEPPAAEPVGAPVEVGEPAGAPAGMGSIPSSSGDDAGWHALAQREHGPASNHAHAAQEHATRGPRQLRPG